MKNKPFVDRLKFAISGLNTAWASEASFRIQVVLGLGALAILLTLRPKAIWWALFILIIGSVLAAELFNTALEYVVDRLHPDLHPAIARAKDCAAGAVLVLSLSALGILTVLLIERFL